MADLRSIVDTCTPHPDVLAGRLADNHFAAQLDQVVRNPAGYPVYGDPAAFFALTYPTTGLKRLLGRTFGRLTRAKVPGAEHGIVRLETSFGGGKTHGLMAVYHLARGARPAGLEEFMDPALLPAECQIAAVVADTLDPVNGLETNARRTWTLWGEIGAQLGAGAFEALRASDAERTAPGKATLAAAVGDRPTIIIIDEIAQYLRQLTSSGNADVRRLAEAVPAFLKNLFELAAGAPHVVVILTLATHADAYGRETDEVATLIDEAEAGFAAVLADTHSLVSRTGSVIKPAEDEEIGQILKRRLFAHIDPDAAEAAGAAYRGLYEGLRAKGEHLAGGAEAPVTYGRSVVASYPFHPELIRVLDKRIGSIPNFQRARGALRLLAEGVAHAWAHGTDADILNVGDLALDNADVLAQLTVGIGRPEMEGVARADFAGPTSHAAGIDAVRFAGRAPYATRACRTVFTHSLELVVTAGAGRNDYLLGTLRPGDEPAVLGEALAEVERVAWHLLYDGSRWRFTVEPQPNKIVNQEAENVPNSLVNEELQERVRRMYPTDGPVVAVHFPTGPASVGDEPRLRLVVYHHDDLTVTEREALPPPSKLTHLLDRAGAAEGIRTFRNAMMFLVADRDGREGMRDLVRFDIAAGRIVADKARMDSFAPEVQKKLRAIADTAKLNARVAIARAYKHLYYPVSDKAHGNLRHVELAAKAQGEVEKAQTRVILDVLRDEGKVRSQAMGTDYLRAKAWPKDASDVTTAAVAEHFWRDFGAQMVLDATILRDAIRDGIKNGTWVYFDAQAQRVVTANDPAPQVVIAADSVLYTPERAAELGLLGRPLAWADVDALMSHGQISAGALRTQLEAELGREVRKSEVLEVLARAADGGPTARAVVVAGPPEPGARASAPTELKAAAFDTLTVLRPDVARHLGIGQAAGPKVTTVEGQGVAGVALQQLVDRASGAAGSAGLTMLSVTAVAEPGEGIRDLSLLGKAIGMLPRFEIEVALEAVLEFRGLKSDVTVNLAGPAAEYQRVEDAFLGLAKIAANVGGRLRLDIRFSQPVVQDGPEMDQIRKVLVSLDPGVIRLRGVLA